VHFLFVGQRIMKEEIHSFLLAGYLEESDLFGKLVTSDVT
jgi:hypothetical protein